MAERTRDYLPGDRIPGTVYQVARLLGAGGMGTVYDVEDTTIGKRYVLKTLHPRLGSRHDLARRMQSEARTLARLNHPNVVDVITAGVTGDDLHLPYYVMERLNGQSLRLVLEKKGQLELPHAYHIGIDLLDALDHAHDKGVIHRDVKPDNIFLHRTAAGVTVTKLLDFGILSLLDSTARETAGRFLGTLRYAAPEQLRGERPTPHVDIYAAALVIYEILAGRGPFDEEGDPRRIAAAHLEKKPPPLSRFVSVPEGLDRLIAAALAKSPEVRPRDAFSFAASLRNMKRALVGAHARESTENRATAASVLGTEPPPAPYASGLDARRSSAEGPYVVSSTPGAAPLRSTTAGGMTSPTLGPVLAARSTTPLPTATTPGDVDRLATTGHFVSDTSPSPQNGTEALGPEDAPLPPPFALPPPPPPPLPPPSHHPSHNPSHNGPLHWPPEQPVPQSEERQFQMVAGDAGRPKRSTGGRVVAGAVVLGLGLVAAAAFVGRSVPGPTGGPAGVPAPVVEVSSAPPAQGVSPRAPAQGVWPPPAPTLAPPLVEDNAPATADAAPPLAASSSPKPVPPASRPAKKSKAAVAASPPDRPGPGF